LAGTGTSSLFTNNGSGRFTLAVGALPANTPCLSVAHGDLDGDGDLDLVLGGGSARVLLNNGRGTFKDAVVNLALQNRVGAIALGDIDADGDPDILLGTGAPVLNPEHDRILINQGSSGFVELSRSRFPSFKSINQGVAFHDIDGDGDLDIVTQSTGNPTGTNSRFRSRFLNDGTGTFTDASQVEPRGLIPAGVGISVTDLDRDGDADLIHVGGWIRIRAGLRRELHAPYLVRPGEVFHLEIWSHAATSPVPLAWVFIALQALPRPVPLANIGLLGIDPTTALLLPTIPLLSKRTEMRLPVPNLNSLRGLPLHLQALLQESFSPGGLRLTRRLEVRLRN
jgi:hypothetical protein